MLLVVLRFLQGIGLGGEWGGAVLMVVENCPTHKRGFLGSMVQVGEIQLEILRRSACARGLISQLPESDWHDMVVWIRFLISVLVGVGLWIRLKMEETAAFRAIKAKNEVVKIPIVEIFRYHRRPVLHRGGPEDLRDRLCAGIAGVFSIMSGVTSRLGLSSRGLVLNGAFIASFVALALDSVIWLVIR